MATGNKAPGEAPELLRIAGQYHRDADITLPQGAGQNAAIAGLT
jgi:hypothetical protein